jgi:hypothetical protein
MGGRFAQRPQTTAIPSISIMKSSWPSPLTTTNVLVGGYLPHLEDNYDELLGASQRGAFAGTGTVHGKRNYASKRRRGLQTAGRS